MKITLSLMTQLMRRVGSNPFASHKTRARNLLLRLQQEGYEVTLAEHPDKFKNIYDLMADLDSEDSTPEPGFDPLHASLEQYMYTPQSLTKGQRARHLFQEAQFTDLHALKKASKKSWAALGFSPSEIALIELALDV